MTPKKTTQGDKADTRSNDAPTTEVSQRECFGEGVKLFSVGDYARARDIFERAARGPALSVTESATMYRRMCDQRLERLRQQTATADQQYATGRELLGQRRHAEALPYLEAAAKSLDTPALHYALALTTGHMGDSGAAARHFRRACELDPGSRAAALRDPEFKILLQFAELRELAAEQQD
jgi:tetratricopeptide (TPR) repeat protein